MPAANTILWTTAVSLIVGMMVIIGWIIDKGFYGLKEDIKAELSKLWEKIDAHQTQAASNAAIMLEHKGVDAERQRACLERHTRIDIEIAHLQKRRNDDGKD